MMNKILLLSLLITPVMSSADVSEEAIILNQELQFLEESANEVTISSLSPSSSQTSNKSRKTEVRSLESQYFSNDEDDDVVIKAAAPKRRVAPEY